MLDKDCSGIAGPVFEALFLKSSFTMCPWCWHLTASPGYSGLPKLHRGLGVVDQGTGQDLWLGLEERIAAQERGDGKEVSS